MAAPPGVTGHRRSLKHEYENCKKKILAIGRVRHPLDRWHKFL
jgi:hypothetical protein